MASGSEQGVHLSAHPTCTCGSVPGPQLVLTKYTLKWCMNDIPYLPITDSQSSLEVTKIKKNWKIVPPLAGFMSPQHIFRGSTPLPGCPQLRCSHRFVCVPATLLQGSPLPAAIVRSLWAMPKLWEGEMPILWLLVSQQVPPTVSLPNPTGKDINYENAEFK